MSLETYFKNGWLKKVATSPQEIADQLGLVARCMKDAQVEGISDDLRFYTAFNAILALANTALRASGYHTAAGKRLFGAMGDSAPDRWGRALMMRAEARRERKAGEPQRTLWESDYLLLVDDETRQGALRFAEKEGGPFLHQVVDHRTPPLIELPALLAASEHVYDEVETADDLRLLLSPGSSLGGPRPKASVRDRDGSLVIAKFPHHADRISTVLWEALASRLASAAGINAAIGRVEKRSSRCRNAFLLRCGLFFNARPSSLYSRYTRCFPTFQPSRFSSTRILRYP
jgi:hypothetical protein